MRKDIKEYFRTSRDMFDKVLATDVDGRVYHLDEAIDMSIQIITEEATFDRKLIFIGNGASASFASHMAVDFWKNAGIRALSFNDAAGLTCISNDFGYGHVFEKPIEMFADSRDILIAISSSGQSGNILLGVKTAKAKGVRVITLSGFDEKNPLRILGEVNFYVPSSRYGHVETMHLSICHCLVDMIIKAKNG